MGNVFDLPSKGDEHVEDTRFAEITNAAYFTDDYVLEVYNSLPKYDGNELQLVISL